MLDEQPLALGEQGPEYRFTASDQARMWQLNRSGESVLPVPVGGTLSQYQLLQGLLIGSAGNYAERLTGNLYPSPAIYARAANTWLARHGVSDITIVDPSGIGQGNLATPAALLQLGELAMANPVIAEIVAQQTAEIPGAGLIKNTNPLLGDPGVVGLKTGYLNGRNLLAAKRVVVDDTSIMIYAVVLDQPTSEERADATRALFDETVNFMRHRPESEPIGLNLYRVGRELERVGDVVTNIAEDVVYLATGEIIRHTKKRLREQAEADKLR